MLGRAIALSDTREDTATSSVEQDTLNSSRRRRERDSPRATIGLGWLVVKFVIPMVTAAFLIVLLTLYLSLRG